ncbi:MAG TPA: hypothetical protein VHV99_21980, partial [Paraburkholderia sp.]|nr:hypothetical protein [Paraburkholderia sp.]
GKSGQHQRAGQIGQLPVAPEHRRRNKPEHIGPQPDVFHSHDIRHALDVSGLRGTQPPQQGSSALSKK